MSLYMRFPGGLAKALTLSYDDGVETDIRLIDIMQKNGLLGTFNLNTGLYAPEGTVYPAGQAARRMSRSQIEKCYKGTGMEVAVHGRSHTYLDRDPVTKCAYQIVKDREDLEEMFGVIVRGMAYPFGTYNDDVIRIARDCGIVYSRTTRATHGFDMPQEPLKLDPTCHHADEQLMPLLDRFLKEDRLRIRNPWMFYLWGHSYEFDAADNWNVIEDFCRAAGGHEDVWYATNIQIIEYRMAFKQLVLSVNGDYVYNPTNTTLWMCTPGGDPRSCAPGERIFIGA